MKLSVYSIQTTLFEGEIKSVIIPTPMGEITVLEGHLPLVSIVDKGKISYTDLNGKQEHIPFDGGILEIRPPAPKSELVILAKEE